MARPVYEATKGPDAEPLLWIGEQERAFNNTTEALTRAPTLGFTNLKKKNKNTFILSVAESRGAPLGVLVQKLEVPQPTGYFPKLDFMAWLPLGGPWRCFFSGRS